MNSFPTKQQNHWCPTALLLSLLLGITPPNLASSEVSEDIEEFPEQWEISEILSGEQPAGMLFLVMEQDEEALNWVLPRIAHYTGQLREKWPEMTIAVLSHGEEMLALLTDLYALYPAVHSEVYDLVNRYDVHFHVCGTFAEMSGYEASEFPDYVDVVPFGPAQIENYRSLDYRVMSIELTW